jgi:3-phenylpropionate/trans-cinnamate dioxygenase ferredoxin reductase subunit
MRTIVVVGASLAGWSVARRLRARGWDGELTLVGAEPHQPYDRPPLSKSYLAGDLDVDGLSLLPAAEDPDAEALISGIRWRLGDSAIALRPDRTVVLASGEELRGDAVVIATGAAPRKLPSATGLAGVHTLRTRTDADELRADLLGGSTRLVVVGAGFIGAEVASTAHRLGVAVEIVDVLPVPMADAVGPELAPVLTGLHAQNGVPLHAGVAVAGLTGRGGRVSGVLLGDGRELPADVVVVGIGVRPMTNWLDGSGIRTQDGVLVDGAGRTNLDGVWACGDVARYPSRRAGDKAVRVEHWTHAREHGTAVADSLLGDVVSYDPVPYVWSEQYGLMIQFAGFARPGDDVEIVDGDPAEHRFVAAYRRHGRLVAAMGMRIPRSFVRLRKELEAS